MRFVVEHHGDKGLLGGAIATFIACETCGLKIQGDQAGIVVFRDEDPRGDGRRDAIAIHKGTCETAVTEAMSSWQELDIFLRDIVLNAQIDMAATEERISGPDGLREWGLHR